MKVTTLGLMLESVDYGHSKVFVKTVLLISIEGYSVVIGPNGSLGPTLL